MTAEWLSLQHTKAAGARGPPQTNAQNFRDVKLIKGQSEGVMTHFFALHLILGGKLDICGRFDLFFCSLLDLGRKTNSIKLHPPPSFKFLGTPLQKTVPQKFHQYFPLTRGDLKLRNIEQRW